MERILCLHSLYTLNIKVLVLFLRLLLKSKCIFKNLKFKSSDSNLNIKIFGAFPVKGQDVENGLE